MRQSFTPSFRPAALVATLLAATGCTTWVKPGATEFERQATLSRCEAVSQVQAPPEIYRVMLSPARETPKERRCSTDSRGRESCVTSGGDYRAAVYSNRDANEPARRAVFHDCMFSHGWQPE